MTKYHHRKVKYLLQEQYWYRNVIFYQDVFIMYNVWIRIGPGFNGISGSGYGLGIRFRIQAGQIVPKKREKKKFHFWRVICGARGFSWSPNFLSKGLRTYTSCIWPFLSNKIPSIIKNLGRDPDPDSLNQDPKTLVINTIDPGLEPWKEADSSASGKIRKFKIPLHTKWQSEPLWWAGWRRWMGGWRQPGYPEPRPPTPSAARPETAAPCWSASRPPRRCPA